MSHPDFRLTASSRCKITICRIFVIICFLIFQTKSWCQSLTSSLNSTVAGPSLEISVKKRGETLLVPLWRIRKLEEEDTVYVRVLSTLPDHQLVCAALPRLGARLTGRNVDDFFKPYLLSEPSPSPEGYPFNLKGRDLVFVVALMQGVSSTAYGEVKSDIRNNLQIFRGEFGQQASTLGNTLELSRKNLSPILDFLVRATSLGRDNSNTAGKTRDAKIREIAKEYGFEVPQSGQVDQWLEALKNTFDSGKLPTQDQLEKIARDIGREFVPPQAQVIINSVNILLTIVQQWIESNRPRYDYTFAVGSPVGNNETSTIKLSVPVGSSPKPGHRLATIYIPLLQNDDRPLDVPMLETNENNRIYIDVTSNQPTIQLPIKRDTVLPVDYERLERYVKTWKLQRREGNTEYAFVYLTLDAKSGAFVAHDGVNLQRLLLSADSQPFRIEGTLYTGKTIESPSTNFIPVRAVKWSLLSIEAKKFVNDKRQIVVKVIADAVSRLAVIDAVNVVHKSDNGSEGMRRLEQTEFRRTMDGIELTLKLDPSFPAGDAVINIHQVGRAEFDSVLCSVYNAFPAISFEGFAGDNKLIYKSDKQVQDAIVRVMVGGLTFVPTDINNTLIAEKEGHLDLKWAKTKQDATIVMQKPFVDGETEISIFSVRPSLSILTVDPQLPDPIFELPANLGVVGRSLRIVFNTQKGYKARVPEIDLLDSDNENFGMSSPLTLTAGLKIIPGKVIADIPSLPQAVGKLKVKIRDNVLTPSTDMPVFSSEPIDTGVVVVRLPSTLRLERVAGRSHLIVGRNDIEFIDQVSVNSETNLQRVTRLTDLSTQEDRYIDLGTANITSLYLLPVGFNMSPDGKQKPIKVKLPAELADIKVVSGLDGLVKISWTASIYAEDYIVYRSETAASPLENMNLIGSVKTTVFEDSTVVNGKPYYYKIAAKNKIGSVVSSEVMAQPQKIIMPPPPQ